MAIEPVHVHKGRITDIELEAGKAELQAQFVELRAKGYSYAKIAKKLRLSKGTLANWSRELEAEIASLKAMELEALQEQYYLLKEGRIRLLGEQVKAMREELKRRDFSDVSTDKLLDLLLKYQAGLSEEFTEARPLSDQQIKELTRLN